MRGVMQALCPAHRVRRTIATSLTRNKQPGSGKHGGAQVDRSRGQLLGGRPIVWPGRTRELGGESGIRTHGTLLTYTRFPSVRLKPLGHLSAGWDFTLGNKKGPLRGPL